ncbi:MAG: hypothetical protein JWP81_5303 [Ferruginibacter sp.]|nr:hypothetical protein [Ferruginibacter sp.]
MDFFTGNKAERSATKGQIFCLKFDIQKRFVGRLKKFSIEITEGKKFKRIFINGNIYYWPLKAHLNSLFIVLAEALLLDHPHYYDSYPTEIRSNDRVLDIGACEGAFCLHAGKRTAKVVAVEPSYLMTEAIRLASEQSNIKNLTLISGVIGSENGELGFWENTDSPEASMIIEKENAMDFRQCWSLDSFIEEFFPDGIDYIKCDAEGADFDILKSGKISLSKYKPRIAVATYHGQDDFEKIQNFLTEFGYSITGQGLHYSAVLRKCYPVLLKAF